MEVYDNSRKASLRTWEFSWNLKVDISSFKRHREKSSSGLKAAGTKILWYAITYPQTYPAAWYPMHQCSLAFIISDRTPPKKPHWVHQSPGEENSKGAKARVSMPKDWQLSISYVKETCTKDIRVVAGWSHEEAGLGLNRHCTIYQPSHLKYIF